MDCTLDGLTIGGARASFFVIITETMTSLSFDNDADGPSEQPAILFPAASAVLIFTIVADIARATTVIGSSPAFMVLPDL